MTESTSAALRIEEGHYGFATDAVRRIVDQAASHEWFPRVSADDEALDRVRSLVNDHLAVLSRHGFGLPSGVVCEFARGGWDVLADAYRDCNPFALADDPAYARGVWRTALGRLVEATRREAVVKETSRYFVPPLFPVDHNPVIVREPLTASQEKMESIVRDDVHRATVWYVMCGVDADYWDAILWEIVHQPTSPANPFRLLIETYLLGFYPLGTVGNTFVIYSRA